MSFTDDAVSPQPTAQPDSPPSHPTPSDADLAAVAATVAVVGVLMALLVAWLVRRLRRAAHSQPNTLPTTARPSFAPSEASSRFGFVRKPLRLSQRRKNTSWDFADPDPFSHQKESPAKHRPAPLSPIPAYSPRTKRASTYKDEFGPRTPTTPSSADIIEPPPPAYCPGPDGPTWQPYHPKDLPPA